MDHANHVQERPRCERQGDAQYEKSGLAVCGQGDVSAESGETPG